MLNSQSSKLKIKLDKGFNDNINLINLAMVNNGAKDPNTLKKLEINELVDFSEEEQKDILSSLILYLTYGRYTRADEKKKFISYINQLLSNIPYNIAYKDVITNEFFDKINETRNLSEKSIKREKRLFDKMFVSNFNKCCTSEQYKIVHLLNKFIEFSNYLVIDGCPTEKYYSYLTMLKQLTDKFEAV